LIVEANTDTEVIFKNVTHAQILIGLITLWFLYSIYKSIDFKKFFHQFKVRGNASVDPRTEQRIQKYWKNHMNTGVKTYHELPEKGFSNDEIEKQLQQLSKVIGYYALS
jgi:hypothetical protein